MSSSSRHSTDHGGIKIAGTRSPRDLPTPAEMREFLAELGTLDPQQIMGPSAEGSLTKGIALATVGTVVLMFLLTIGPWAWNRAAAHSKSTVPATAEQSTAAAVETVADKAPAAQPPAEKAPAEKPAAEAVAVDKAAAAEPGKPVMDDKVLKRLGVDEVKNADPNVNPLESKLDDLLDKAK